MEKAISAQGGSGAVWDAEGFERRVREVLAEGDFVLVVAMAPTKKLRLPKTLAYIGEKCRPTIVIAGLLVVHEQDGTVSTTLIRSQDITVDGPSEIPQSQSRA
jgi:hypothetical protein